MNTPNPPVSLAHPARGKTYTIQEKVWKVASVHMSGGKFWAWIVNVKNTAEQARFPVDSLPAPN